MEIEELIIKYSSSFQISADLVRAIVRVESAYNPWATRFESNWQFFYKIKEFAKKARVTEDTEKVQQSMSWGLGQLMGSVARELGFDLELPQLCIPNYGIYYCCKKLQLIEKRYQEPDQVISAYNAGSALKKADGTFINAEYVRKVHEALARLSVIH